MLRLWRFLEIVAMLEWLWDKYEGLREKMSQLNEFRKQELEAAIRRYQSNGYSRKKAEVYALWELDYIEGSPENICELTGIS